ncbi:MAG: HAMP domain-containing histidine kinase [Candidatus Melainabacteria bacterium]|nr:HAMP domain-containing histidine kinase [Candidatus Melainabacteria bacterium]
MKARTSLYLQVFNLLVLYLLLLCAIVFFVFNSAFGFGWETLIASPIGERVDTVAGAVSGQLRGRPTSQFNEVLLDFGRIYNVQFYIFDGEGQLAGEKVDLPQAVAGRVQMLLPPGFMGDRIPRPPVVGGPPPPHGSGRFIVHSGRDGRFWIGTRLPLTGDGAGMSPVLLPGRQFYPPGFPEPFHPAVLLAASDNIWQSSLVIDFAFVGAVAAAILVISIAFWYPFVYSLAGTIAQLTLATERIAEGNFDVRLHSGRTDELGRLAEAVNALAGKLNGFVTGQKRFLGDISHELRSPIARLQMALELLSSSHRLSEEEQNRINDIREEVQEMTHLVSELLAFSKAGLKGSSPEMKPVNLHESVRTVVERLGLNERVELDFTDNPFVEGDAILLERAVSNVLRNCVRYAGEGAIKVRMKAGGAEHILTIADEGPGVAAEALPHLTEPFYRPESSRSRSLGGVGLGLAIVKTCVEACGGTVSLGNAAAGGLEVQFKLKAVGDKSLK